MSFLSKVVQTSTSFYTEQALEADSSVGGLCPNYYDHYRINLSAGYIQITKPVKGGTNIEPFQPDNVFSLQDVNGQKVLHQFVAMEAMPIGYFIGASLSNWEQELPGERKGTHCQTSRAVLELGDGTKETIYGRRPLQSSSGINYSFRKYNEDKTAPGVYAGNRFETYGSCTPEFAQAVGRPQQISCAECVSKNWDSFDKNSCKTQGEFALYVYKLAFKSPNGLEWRDVKDFGIAELGDGFVAIADIKAADLRKQEIDFSNNFNRLVPASASCAHLYVTNLYKRQEPTSTLMIEFGNSKLQTLAYPTQLFVAKLKESVGKISNCLLYTNSPIESQLELSQRHGLLEKALLAYETDRKKESTEIPLYVEPAAIEAAPPTGDVRSDIRELAKRASSVSATQLFGQLPN